MSELEATLHAEYEEAKRLVLHLRHASVSLVQRRMRMSYTRAKAIIEALTTEGVLSAPTKAGFRLLQPRYVSNRDFAASAQDKHVRLLRDLALYLLECEELGYGPDTRCLAMIVHPLEIPAGELTAAAARADRAQTQVLAIAMALAKLPQLAALFVPDTLAPQLGVSCAPCERRPVHIELDAEERRRRGLVQLARYFEKRLIDCEGANTRAFECFVRDDLLPIGRGHAGGSYREHVVPCAMLRDRCMELQRGGLPVDAAAEWMLPYLAIVMITPEQAKTLDTVLGLKARMPENWRFDLDCIFDRLHKGGITFDPPPDQTACMH